MSTVDYAGRHGYEAPSGDGQERLFDGIPARIFLQPIAAPSILGLFGFMAATLMVGANMAGWYGDARTPSFLFPFAAVFGGIAQLAAGLWSYRARDALATAIHGAWGSFWIAYGILWLLVVTGNLTLPLPGQAFPALAFWFIGLAAITWSGALASLAESVAIFGVLSTLATASTIAAVSLFVGDESWVKVAGWVFVFSAGLAWYTATAMMLAATSGRTVLPLGKYTKTANRPGGRPVQAVEFAAGEPGVHRGQ